MLPVNPDKRAAYLDYVNRSFRDVADQDYLAARLCYLNDLKLQFLWAAQQCVEKYLKGILLFSGYSTKQYGHDLSALFVALEKEVVDIKFDFPPAVGKFIAYLDRHGVNRYFEFPYQMKGDELLILDQTVWHLRRYCQHIRVERQVGNKAVDWFTENLKSIQDPCWLKRPNKFKIFGGLLEALLYDKRRSHMRDILTWKNLFFGKNTKKMLRTFTFRGGSGNPTPFLHPEIFADLERVIRFSKDVRDHFAAKKPSR